MPRQVSTPFKFIDGQSSKISTLARANRKLTILLRTNGVRLDPGGGGGPGGMGLFTAYALVNHSCVPNVRTLKDGRRSLRVVAVADIEEGEEILTRYITPQFDTAR